jgi:hypothetical protein
VSIRSPGDSFVSAFSGGRHVKGDQNEKQSNVVSLGIIPWFCKDISATVRMTLAVEEPRQIAPTHFNMRA